MAQYVDIMTDAGFKAVFQDKQVTIKFLNAALAGRTADQGHHLPRQGDQARDRREPYHHIRPALRGRVRGQVHPRDAELSPALFL